MYRKVPMNATHQCSRADSLRLAAAPAVSHGVSIYSSRVTVVFLAFSRADLGIDYKRYWGRWLVRTCSSKLCRPLA